MPYMTHFKYIALIFSAIAGLLSIGYLFFLSVSTPANTYSSFYNGLIKHDLDTVNQLIVDGQSLSNTSWLISDVRTYERPSRIKIKQGNAYMPTILATSNMMLEFDTVLVDTAFGWKIDINQTKINIDLALNYSKPLTEQPVGSIYALN